MAVRHGKKLLHSSPSSLTLDDLEVAQIYVTELSHQISNVVRDTMLDAMEVNTGTKNGLAIGTMTLIFAGSRS